MTGETWLLVALVAAIALLYASVGHGGASGYLAAMALVGVAPETMRPTALALNILVAGLAAWQFGRWLSWRLFWPFALASVPAAAVGRALTLPDPIYRRVVGLVLLYGAFHLFWTAARASEPGVRPPPLALSLPLGGGLGVLAGLTGVGGGIFLSPLLLSAGWAGARETAAASALFILVNSLAGLTGYFATRGVAPGAGLALLVAAAGLGGLAGAHLGSRRLSRPGIRRLLALVLILAALKFLLLL